VLTIDVITAFPKMIEEAVSYSIPGRSIKRGLAQLRAHDLRNYTHDKHRTIDDTPYGGRGGMVLKPEPVFECIETIFDIEPIGADDHIRNHITPDTEVILLTPRGTLFTQQVAVELSMKSRLVMICGHYKGVDERVAEKLITRSVSIGDFVCSGGELPALIMIDAMVRLIPGVLNDSESALTDSFQDGLLDCACYTKPENFRNMNVPPVLLSGHHAEIQRWREQQKMNITRQLRPDLINNNE
jgi:tRNA (guanine37-N1)-methyltransferase